MEALIIPVGISAIRNYNRARGSADIFAIPAAEKLTAYISSDPETASAELNTLSKLDYDPDAVHVHLIASETDLGSAAAVSIKQYLETRMGTAAELYYIPHLEDNVQTFVQIGINEFVNKMLTIIQKYQGNARILATGGYKAQTAYATMVGILTRVPVYYIHEKFSKVVELPGLPLQFDRSEYRRYEEQIQAVLASENNEDARNIIEKKLPSSWMPLFQKKQEVKGYEWSPAGRIYEQIMSTDVHPPVKQSDVPPLQKADADTHHTMWGKSVTGWEDIPSEHKKVLQLFTSSCPGVQSVKLGERKGTKQDIPVIKLIRKDPHMLVFEYQCQDGTQVLTFGITEQNWTDAEMWLGIIGLREIGDSRKLR